MSCLSSPIPSSLLSLSLSFYLYIDNLLFFYFRVVGLAFGRDVPVADGPVLNLSPSGDLAEAAANLFGHLRTLDAAAACGIAVMPIPGEGLGEAIRDRLARAAAPRS